MQAPPGQQCQTVTQQSKQQGGGGALESLIYFLSIIMIICTFPVSICACIRMVNDYERVVIYRLGRLDGAKGPGLFFIIPCMDDVIPMDLRTMTYDVPPQEILTKDSVTVAIDAVVYYRVVHPTMCVNNIRDYTTGIRLLSQTTLRNILGKKTLGGILSDREEISHSMQTELDEATDPWGIKVERVEVKDIRLPHQMQRAMAAEAEAAREAQAKIIAAQGEFDASKALADAADVIAQSKGALQLRFLQTLATIAAEKNSTIVFPLPIDMLPTKN